VKQKPENWQSSTGNNLFWWASFQILALIKYWLI